MNLISKLLSALSIATFGATVAVADTSFVDQDYSCVETNTNKKYDDIFIIEVRKSGLSKIKYKRRHSCNTTNSYGALEIIRGCYHARQKKSEYKPQLISVNCDSDGEEGIFYVDRTTLKGHIYFYKPKIGYSERTGLDLKCTKIQTRSV